MANKDKDRTVKPHEDTLVIFTGNDPYHTRGQQELVHKAAADKLVTKKYAILAEPHTNKEGKIVADEKVIEKALGAHTPFVPHSERKVNLVSEQTPVTAGDDKGNKDQK